MQTLDYVVRRASDETRVYSTHYLRRMEDRLIDEVDAIGGGALCAVAWGEVKACRLYVNLREGASWEIVEPAVFKILDEYVRVKEQAEKDVVLRKAARKEKRVKAAGKVAFTTEDQEFLGSLGAKIVGGFFD